MDDPEKSVQAYRDAVAKRDAATTNTGKAKAEAVIRRLRAEWKNWQGEDSLHEMAFGEDVA